MPKGQHSEDNPSFVITAKMNPELSATEREAWEIWQRVDRRTVLKAGFTSKAEYLATALIEYDRKEPMQRESRLEQLMAQILNRLNSGVIASRQQDDELADEDVMLSFAHNRQMMNEYTGND